MRHETPQQVAQLLAKHAPRKVRSLLDPAAGVGVLARPFFKRTECKRIQLLDIDHSVISLLRSETASTRSVSVLEENFLKWSAPNGIGYGSRFDCIIMNPPFAGKLKDHVYIELSDKKKIRSVPVEVAFVYLGSRLLHPGGRLLAVLPASVVSGESTIWLRRYLMQEGNIRLVHELPRRTFSGVEGRMYILVFERAKRQRTLISRNHRLRNPDELHIRKRGLINTFRLDFRFHEAQSWLARIQSWDKLGWARLDSMATVLRGDVDSPIKNSRVLHTTNMLTFRATKSRRSQLANNERLARCGDIILKRVGRHASASAIIYRGRYMAPCSDCILIIRPHTTTDVNRLLFALRTIIAWSQGAGLVEHGVAATYIPADSLRFLEVPMCLAELCPKMYTSFVASVNRCDWEGLPHIEASVRRRIARKLVKHG